jgi:deazaflavin-dependent oxidoreductase (nitroreductase family)
MTAMSRLNAPIYHLIGRRLRMQGLPLLLLITVGAKTGKVRKTMLGAFPQGDNAWLVVASNAGASRHPGWYVNMAKNPDRVGIEIGRRKVKVQPRSLSGEERAAAWRHVVEVAPAYASYETRTDREIPIVRLQAVRRPRPSS